MVMLILFIAAESIVLPVITISFTIVQWGQSLAAHALDSCSQSLHSIVSRSIVRLLSDNADQSVWLNNQSLANWLDLASRVQYHFSASASWVRKARMGRKSSLILKSRGSLDSKPIIVPYLNPYHQVAHAQEEIKLIYSFRSQLRVAITLRPNSS